MSADVEINKISDSITKLRNESYARGLKDGIKLMQDGINRIINEQVAMVDKSLNEFEDRHAVVENYEINEENSDDNFVSC